eukprot:SAG31_NODE_1117_length_9817_cov_6.416650_5_plen_726_part_00
MRLAALVRGAGKCQQHGVPSRSQSVPLSSFVHLRRAWRQFSIGLTALAHQRNRTWNGERTPFADSSAALSWRLMATSLLQRHHARTLHAAFRPQVRPWLEQRENRRRKVRERMRQRTLLTTISARQEPTAAKTSNRFRAIEPWGQRSNPTSNLIDAERRSGAATVKVPPAAHRSTAHSRLTAASASAHNEATIRVATAETSSTANVCKRVVVSSPSAKLTSALAIPSKGSAPVAARNGPMPHPSQRSYSYAASVGPEPQTAPAAAVQQPSTQWWTANARSDDDRGELMRQVLQHGEEQRAEQAAITEMLKRMQSQMNMLQAQLIDSRHKASTNQATGVAAPRSIVLPSQRPPPPPFPAPRAKLKRTVEQLRDQVNIYEKVVGDQRQRLHEAETLPRRRPPPPPHPSPTMELNQRVAGLQAQITEHQQFILDRENRQKNAIEKITAAVVEPILKQSQSIASNIETTALTFKRFSNSVVETADQLQNDAMEKLVAAADRLAHSEEAAEQRANAFVQPMLDEVHRTAAKVKGVSLTFERVSDSVTEAADRIELATLPLVSTPAREGRAECMAAPKVGASRLQSPQGGKPPPPSERRPLAERRRDALRNPISKPPPPPRGPALAKTPLDSCAASKMTSQDDEHEPKRGSTLALDTFGNDGASVGPIGWLDAVVEPLSPISMGGSFVSRSSDSDFTSMLQHNDWQQNATNGDSDGAASLLARFRESLLQW